MNYFSNVGWFCQSPRRVGQGILGISRKILSNSMVKRGSTCLTWAHHVLAHHVLEENSWNFLTVLNFWIIGSRVSGIAASATTLLWRGTAGFFGLLKGQCFLICTLCLALPRPPVTDPHMLALLDHLILQGGASSKSLTWCKEVQFHYSIYIIYRWLISIVFMGF